MSVQAQNQNAASRGYLEPNTVVVRKNGTMRIGQDLLGDFAGKKNLGFAMFLKGDVLELCPMYNAGYSAKYPGKNSLSPIVSILMFYRQCRAKPPKSGTYQAYMNITDNSSIVISIDFGQRQNRSER